MQAEAWLAGQRYRHGLQDMKALVNYLWDKPEDREIVQETIIRLTENPLGDKLDELLARAYQYRDEFDSADSPGLGVDRPAQWPAGGLQRGRADEVRSG